MAGEIEESPLPCYTCGMRVMDIAYIRDGKLLHTEEAVILACLLRAKGKGRSTPDMTDVQRIMRDPNRRQLNRKV